MNPAVMMLMEMFGVQADTAQVTLHYCGSDVAAAGRLLAQQARGEERDAAQAAIAEARREDREAAQDALECSICMEAPKTHSFAPCNHRCVCGHCAELVMQRDKRCPYCREEAESAQEVFLI